MLQVALGIGQLQGCLYSFATVTIINADIHISESYFEMVYTYNVFIEADHLLFYFARHTCIFLWDKKNPHIYGCTANRESHFTK